MDAPSLPRGTRFTRLTIATLSALVALSLLGASPRRDPARGDDSPPAPGPPVRVKAPADKHVTGRELIDIGSIADLEARFEKDRGVTRLVLIFSPTCIDCIKGARWLQQDILSKHPRLPLHVYAVWFHRLTTDRRDVWPRAALPDGRVEHFWEEGSSISRWYGKAFHTRRPVPWNVYFLYTPGADSLGVPDSVPSWGSWVSDSREKIRQTMERLTGAKL